ncbi:MAG: hypothetical protein V9E98_04485 [Candidatus Nanopelagicales bacterium]
MSVELAPYREQGSAPALPIEPATIRLGATTLAPRANPIKLRAIGLMAQATMLGS